MMEPSLQNMCFTSKRLVCRPYARQQPLAMHAGVNTVEPYTPAPEFLKPITQPRAAGKQKHTEVFWEWRMGWVAD